MEKTIKKEIIVFAIIALIILAGIIVALTVGFNFEFKYQETKRINLYLEKSFEISDIQAITEETLGKQKTLIQKVEVYEDSVSIMAKEITEEQKQALIEKINEKYETSFDANLIEIETVPNTRGRDLLKPYIMPFTIATVIILAYISIRFKKLGWLNIVARTITTIIIIEALLFSFMAITRIPVGDITMPLVSLVYIATFIAIMAKLEEKLNKVAM